MANIPTDIEIFETRYGEYSAEFVRRSKMNEDGQPKNYVPIDIEKTAEKLGTDTHELFGRLYYHLDQKYRYEQKDGAMVHFFGLVVGDEKHCVNFPYLSGLLAGYRVQDRRNRWALALSIISIVIAATALLTQLITSTS